MKPLAAREGAPRGRRACVRGKHDRPTLGKGKCDWAKSGGHQRGQMASSANVKQALVAMKT